MATTVDFNHPNCKLVNDDVIVRNTDAPPVTMNEEMEVLEEIARYVESKLVNVHRFVHIPIPNDESNLFTTVLASPDWMSATKLLLILQNSSRSVMGIFSRSLCLEKGLYKGSMLSYVSRALSSGYAVILMRPNTNSVTIAEEPPGNGMRKVPIPGSESPDIHVLCVWQNVIKKNENFNHIALVGYGNGASLCKDLFLHEMVASETGTFENKIKAFVTIEASTIIEEDDPVDSRNELDQIAINLEINDAAKGSKLSYRREKVGCTCLSLGLPKGTTGEILNRAAGASLAMDPVFNYLAMAEKHSKDVSTSGSSLSARFAAQFAADNGLVKDLEIKVAPPSADHDDLAATTSPASTKVHVPPEPPTLWKRFTHLFVKEDESEVDSTLETGKLTVQDFDLLKIIGKGAFGKVMLVKKKTGIGAGKIYAMKVLKKSMIVEKNQMEHAKSERDILNEIKHPFIVRLRFAFQSEGKLYLITDYYNGGTLFFHLRKAICFSEGRARFYAAELLLALEHLHSQSIIYRDLKLENVLLDHLGHVALTDFGLSKQDIDKTGGATTFCGTPDYVAPELLRNHKYGKAVDWWSFGVLIFEMINGQTPFFDRNRKEMFKKIVNTDVVIPSSFSFDASNCIRGLLTRNVSKRLGSGPEGVRAIKDEAFFMSINFDALLNRELRPPMKPDVANEHDTRYVPKFFLDTKAVDSIDNSASKPNPDKLNLNPKFDAFTFQGDPMID